MRILTNLMIICLMMTVNNVIGQKNNINKNVGPDPHSFSNFNEVSAASLHLDLELDFDNHVVSGVAEYELNAHSGVSKMIFDVKDIEIEQVLVDGNDVEHKIGKKDPILGSSLTVKIKDDSKKISIRYRTTEASEGVQWLSPEQADSDLPFMYTQGEAILTRSWIPIQDSPAAKLRYTASVTAPNSITAVMSATKSKASSGGVQRFEQKNPIPCYLIALAAGELVFEPISSRSGIYAAPSIMSLAKIEFGELEKMITVAEKLAGPYDWDRYDLLVLPRAFPFGGMENPQLTFVTPTILAGDRSLIALVAHELAHSWSGNTITNARWDDFWLNEGFTVYLERRIVEEMYGKAYAHMHRYNGISELKATLEDLEEQDTHLKLNLNGRNPDDGMTDVAYEKGAAFLEHMEKELGRKIMDQFIITYFKKFRYQVLTTEDLIAHLDKTFRPTVVDLFDIDKWIYGAGLPDDHYVVVPPEFKAIDTLHEKIARGELPEVNSEKWTVFEWLYFLRNLPEEGNFMKELDQAFGISISRNSEIRAEWYKQSIKRNHEAAYDDLTDFLRSIGRRKFLAPLYKAMLENPNTRKLAKDTYAEARAGYHSISTNTLDQMMEKYE